MLSIHSTPVALVALLLVATLLSCRSTSRSDAGGGGGGDAGAIEALLDDFHDAASKADGERYFGHFTPDAVFIGTDPHERWDVAAFRAYAEPYFSKGRGWTYVRVSRHVSFDAAGRVAWFDEKLENASYGIVRGSGVLERRDGRWRIAQYVLSFEVPNDLGGDVVRMIREAGTEDAGDSPE